MSEKYKILLVDDDDIIAALEEEVLKSYGYIVDRASNGLEAVGKLEFNTYNLIVSDYLMPQMNGEQFYKYLQEKHPEMLSKFIIVSGSISDTNFFVSKGVVVLNKPFNIKEFAQTVNDVITKS
ncbi:MAG: response regulator [Thermodesulfobacteriota bacterium]